MKDKQLEWKNTELNASSNGVFWIDNKHGKEKEKLE